MFVHSFLINNGISGNRSLLLHYIHLYLSFWYLPLKIYVKKIFYLISSSNPWIFRYSYVNKQKCQPISLHPFHYFSKMLRPGAPRPTAERTTAAEQLPRRPSAESEPVPCVTYCQIDQEPKRTFLYGAPPREVPGGKLLLAPALLLEWE